MDRYEKYFIMFDEQFPIMQCMGLSKKEIDNIVDQCIKNGVPYEHKKGMLY